MFPIKGATKPHIFKHRDGKKLFVPPEKVDKVHDQTWYCTLEGYVFEFGDTPLQAYTNYKARFVDYF